jgi:hypothetical protein
MSRLSVVTWIGNAAAVLGRRWGSVTTRTREVGCSRQAAYDHAHRVEQAVTDEQQGGPARSELLRLLAEVRAENRQLWQELEHAIDLPVAKQQHFATLAAALGLSLNQTERLFEVLLPADARPSRATLGRWVEAAALRAGRVLQTLDETCQAQVTELCLDEIYCHRQPVLVGVEPHSMAWMLGRRAPNCTGDTWQQSLQPWTRLESVVADAGTGLQAGLEKFRQQRSHRPDGQPLEVGLDLFHTKQEAQRVLRVLWAPVEQAWLKAEKASEVLIAKRWHGPKLPARRAAHAAARAWRKAEKVFRAYERQETAWRWLEAGFELYRPNGQLNDRAWAQGQIAQAVQDLTGPVWSKVRNFVLDPRSLTFLDRMHRRLRAAEPRAEVRAALVEWWRLRHAGPRGRGPIGTGNTRVIKPLLQGMICQGLATDWREAYRRVALVLGCTVRASSVVECMNSVVRMHQARHRTLSQPLLDLKRLYWNCRSFVSGKRRGACPYQHLGITLPTYDWWQLLNGDTEESPQEVSSHKVAA